MLRTSALCAAVLVRRRDDLPAAFQQHASYLDFENPHGFDAIDRQLECTKSELGLKLFLDLAFRGERGLAAYVEEQYAKTLALWELLRERPGFARARTGRRATSSASASGRPARRRRRSARRCSSAASST